MDDDSEMQLLPNCLKMYKDINITAKNVACEMQTLRLFAHDFATADICQCDWSCMENTYDVTSWSISSWPAPSVMSEFVYSYAWLKKGQVRTMYKDEFGDNMPTSHDSCTNINKKNESEKRNQNPTDNETTGTSAENSNAPKDPSVARQRNDKESSSTGHGEKAQCVSYADMVGKSGFTVEQWVKKHFARVNIYFTDTEVESHEQVPSVGMADLWSSIGGVLGLWAGISIITVVEIINLIYNVLAVIISRLKLTNKT